jgi:antibiotic biosynthesis monooxygenase (ABM) superfamily enzyme
MKILRWFGIFFTGLLIIGALLSLFTPVLPHPRDLSLPTIVLIAAQLLVYFAVEMVSLFFEAIGLAKRGARAEKKISEPFPEKKPRPRS